jgi:IclR family transcriptional regulator, acetate operon repressor
MFAQQRTEKWIEVVGTVSKALGLLDILKSPDEHLGLTEIARRAGFDKATTRRMLLELMANGFVEQDDGSKNYVLGPSLQMLGKAREERFPLYKTVQPIVRALSEDTGETVHAAEYGAGMLISVCTQESDKANRVSLTMGQKLPLHATASGIAYLAACTQQFADQYLKKPRQTFTTHTPIAVADILQRVQQTRLRGYSLSNQTMEDGVHSVAAAFVDQRGKPVGTIAVAMPSIRATPAKLETCGKAAAQAARTISSKLFGPQASLRRAS